MLKSLQNYFVFTLVLIVIHTIFLSTSIRNIDFASGYAIGVFTALVISLLLLASNKLSIPLRLINGVITFALSIYAINSWTYTGNLSYDAAVAISQTNFAEALSYVLATVHFFGWVVVALFTALVVVLQPNRPMSFMYKNKWIHQIALYAALVIVAVSIFKVNYHVINRHYNFFYIMEATNDYHNKVMQMSKVFAERAKILDRERITTEFHGNVIFVLGETTSRFALSAFGYHRQTTPLLEKRIENNQAIAFKDVITPYTVTSIAVPHIISMMDYRKGQDINTPSAFDLLSIIKRAGFFTWWLSNQSRSSFNGNAVPIFGEQANVFVFKNQNIENGARADYDEVLLPYIKDAIDNKTIANNKFIIAHIMGSHTPYNARYPLGLKGSFDDETKEFYGNNASDYDTVSEFENTVLYTDKVLDTIYTYMDNNSQPYVMVYFSDHGEPFMKGKVHGPASSSMAEFNVPFVVYVNKAFKDMYPAKYQAILNAKDKPFNTEYFTHTMLDLLDVNFSYRDDTKSLFSDNYSIGKRTSLHGKINYDAPSTNTDYVLRTFNNLKMLKEKLPAEQYEKLVAYNVNTYGALDEAHFAEFTKVSYGLNGNNVCGGDKCSYNIKYDDYKVLADKMGIRLIKNDDVVHVAVDITNMLQLSDIDKIMEAMRSNPDKYIAVDFPSDFI